MARYVAIPSVNSIVTATAASPARRTLTVSHSRSISGVAPSMRPSDFECAGALKRCRGSGSSARSTT